MGFLYSQGMKVASEVVADGMASRSLPLTFG